MADEIEIKFRVEDREALLRSLRAAGFRELTPRTHEMNVLYDLPGLPLRARGELLRLRQYGARWTVTHKAPAASAPGRHKQRMETETVVEEGEAMQRIFAALGLKTVFRYEKFRSEFTDGQGHVVLDETPIGDFGEIEGAPGWIDAVAARLGVAQAGYITESYAELFRAWKARSGSPAQELTFAAVGQAGK